MTKRSVLAMGVLVGALSASSAQGFSIFDYAERPGHYELRPHAVRMISSGRIVDAGFPVDDPLLIDGPGRIRTEDDFLYGRLVTTDRGGALEELTEMYLRLTGQETTRMQEALSRAQVVIGYDPDNCGCVWSSELGRRYRNPFDKVQSKMDFEPVTLNKAPHSILPGMTLFYPEPDTTRSVFVDFYFTDF